MYSSGVPTHLWETSDSPLDGRNSGRNIPSSSSLSEMEIALTGEKKTQRLCDMISAALEGSQGTKGAKRDVFRNVIKSLGYSLTPVAVAEIILLVGKVIASTGRTDKEQFESTRFALVEAIDSLAAVNWDAVFLALPHVDRSLKITSIEAFAFLVATFHTKKNPDVRFPVEIGLRGRWQSTLSQALFLKWVVVSIAATSIPTLYQRIPLLVYLRNVEVPADTALLETCPPLFPTKSPLTALWSNSQLVLALANIAINGANETTSSVGAEQAEAERIAIELLKRPTVNFFDVFLGTLVKSVELPVALSRFLASVCMDQFWTLLLSNQSQSLPPANFTAYIRGLSCLSPSRFGSVVLASLYPAHADRVEIIIAALQPEPRVLSEVLNGPSPPFCFHALHLAKSKSFSPALWLKERLKTNDFESIIKDFMSFLMLVLCPAKLFQQYQQKMSQQLALNHPLRRLYISPRDLLLYLYVIAEALYQHRSSSLSLGGVQSASFLNAISTELYSVNLSEIAVLPEDVVLKDILKVKHSIAKLYPALVGVLDFIQPSNSETEFSDGPSRKLDGTQPLALQGGGNLINEVDAEVHKYFTALFSGQMSCAEMIATVEHMSKSPQNSLMYKVFDAIIRLLFHECRFLHKYPPSELSIIAELMGCLIQSGILIHHGATPGESQIVALQCILENLRKESQSKSFRFATTSMEYFMTQRIALCPSFLHELITVSTEFRQHFPSYIEFATKCLEVIPQQYHTIQSVLDSLLLADLPLPPSPQPFIHPEFSLTRFKNASQNTDFQESSENTQITVPCSSDGLPPQRQLEIDGRPVLLKNFGLGSVEKLLSSDPALRCMKPPPWVCDQIAQILNSLVFSNIQQNANELRNILQPQWYPYFALCIVRSRVAKEISFHEVYIKMIEAIGRPKLLDTVVSTTYDCINILLCYCDSAAEFLPYRKYLKNLGGWLGIVTLAQNKPLMSKSIDLKNLILDAYKNNRLPVVLPFCCKVIESVVQSKNFRPPNPWSVAILSLLADVQGLQGIGSLVFEVEVLFKNLGLNINDFKGKTNYLTKQKMGVYSDNTAQTTTPKDAVNPKQKNNVSPQDSFLFKHKSQMLRSSTQAQQPKVSSTSQWNGFASQSEQTLSQNLGLRSNEQLSQLIENRMNGLYSSEPGSSVLGSDAALVRTFGPPLVPPSNNYVELDQHPAPNIGESGSADSFGKSKGSLLKTLMKSVVVSPSIVLFKLKPVLKSVIPQAIENAIREIVQVVAERSVTISCVTAREIVLRDFSAESNQNLVRRAAQLFVASLAGSVALVTCREPLRAALNQHIRNSLLSVNYKLVEDQRLVDQVVSVTTSDNIELGCALVEEAVVQLSVHKVKEVLYPALVARQQARQTEGPWVDPAYPTTRWQSLLPAALLPRPIVSGEQLEVYKDFFLLGPLERMQNNQSGMMSTSPHQSERNLNTPDVENFNASTPGVNPTESSFVNISDIGTASAGETAGVGSVTHFDHGAPLETTVELQAVLMRVEESLSHIKDMVYEIAFSSPTIKALPSSLPSKIVAPLGCMFNVLPIPETINVHVATFAWLPSDHDIFTALMNTSLCCTFYKDVDGAFLSVCRRILRVINEFSVFYRETPAVIRLSNVAGLYLEVFLALLTYIRRSIPYSRAQCDEIINEWLTGIISIKFFGPAVAVGLLRYQLITASQLDTLLASLLMETKGATVTNNTNAVSALDTSLRVLFQMITQATCFSTPSTCVLRDFKSTCSILRRAIESRDSSNPCEANKNGEDSLSHGMLQPAETSFTAYHVFSMSLNQIQRIVMNFISQNPKEQCETSNETKPSIVSTVIELLDSYVTLGGPVIHIRGLPVPLELTTTQRETVASCFQQWIATSCVVGVERRAKAYAMFFQYLAKQHFLNLNHETDIFLTGCIEHTVDMVITQYPDLKDLRPQEGSDASPEIVRMETPPAMECSASVFKPLNIFAKLVVALMHSSDFPHISSLLFLQRVMSLIVRAIYRDMSRDVSGVHLQVYYGMLLNLLWEVRQPSKGLDQQSLSILVCFSNTFLSLSPCECPHFVFCWLELIAHSSFLPAILAHVRAWPYFAKLVARLLRFLYPFHQKIQSSPGVLAIFKGTLRLLLVLLHDFPEFLCEYYVMLTENIPLNSIQLRNLILSAFPRNTALPDPFIPNLKMDLLLETRKAPRVYGNFLLLLTKSGIKQELDCFQRSQDIQHIKNIVKKLKLTDEKAIIDTGIHYNVSLINAMFLYLVSQVPLEKQIFSAKTGPESTAMLTKITFHLIEQLDPEGRYITISCISNNLRYPNMHTHHFSCLILWLFNVSAPLEMVQEQITRVLLERLIAHRPHPWGLLITFIELMKNSQFNFWACPFIHTVSDVQYLFQSVAQTCLNQSDVLQNKK